MLSPKFRLSFPAPDVVGAILRNSHPTFGGGPRKTKGSESPYYRGSNQEQVIALPNRPGGAALVDLRAATGWQPHPVRGAISGALKKRLGFDVVAGTPCAGGAVFSQDP